MGSTDCCRLLFSRRGLGAALTLVLLVLVGAGLAWGATGSIGGSANPLPDNSSPALNDVYNVGLEISNTSKSTSQPPNPTSGLAGQKNIMVNVTSAKFILACTGSPCDAADGNQTPGVVTFFPTTPNTCEAGSAACVLANANSCTVDPTTNIVTVDTTGCTLNPGQGGVLIAIIRVKQTATPGSFVMGGRASYQGIAGTCVSGVCDNVATPNSCTVSNPDCNFTAVTGDATGNTNFTPEFCGDGILQTSLGETCDPPGSVQANGNVCRNDCTFCGDGTVQTGDGETCDPTAPGAPANCRPSGPNACTFCGDGTLQTAAGEQCDDGNNVDHDGCSATCLLEPCSVQVDKQVSCTGNANDFHDVGLETTNEDGTIGVTCPRNTPVFVRYVAHNNGQADATCSSLTESNLQIVSSGQVFTTSQPLPFNATVGPTNPFNPSCTDTLAASEPDTATLSCTCPNGTGGTATATAFDTATIACAPFCGDGIIDTARGETCDGTAFPANAPSTHGTCRADCTFCGDGHQDAGEQCDDGNAINADNCHNDCTLPFCGDGIVNGTETCDPTAPGAPANCRTSGPDACTFCGDGVIQSSSGEQCEPPGTATCDANCHTGKVCPFVSPSLGPPIAAAPDFCAVLHDGGGKVDITGPAGQFQGNICIGDSGHLSMSGENFLTNPGEVLLEAGASCSGCKIAPTPPADGKNGNVNSIDQPVDLTADFDACDAARAAHTPPVCTETINTLQDIVTLQNPNDPNSGVISRTGVNVICISNQKEVKKNIRLTGNASTKYTFVVNGKFKYNQAKVTTDCTPSQATPPANPAACTAAGVGPDDVLWLFVGSGQELRSSGGGGGVGCCNAVLDGSVIIDGTIALSPGLINGAVCGSGDWAFVSGSGVHCPDP